MRPAVETRITQHTLWQAITGQAPPLDLPATPIAKAVLDNRDVAMGDLFVAFPGRFSDGNEYVGAALEAGAQAAICESQGIDNAAAQGAQIVDCRSDTESEKPLASTKFASDGTTSNAKAQKAIAYIVDDSELALQRLGAFQRTHRTRTDLRVIGITGSVGKSTTKELTAAVLRQRFCTFHNPGNLNSEQGLPLSLLGLGFDEERAILEMGMYDVDEIAQLCALARPQVGVITNIGPVHLERLGSMARIQQAKAELVQALPSAKDGGVAILNWDDELVRPMEALTDAHIFRYGLSPEAELWADKIESAGREGIRFCFHYQGEDVQIHLPLMGKHSVYTALRAAAVGLVEGLEWDEIVTGLQSVQNQIRLVMMPGINGSTMIDDTYNASPASTVAALDLLDDLTPDSSEQEDGRDQKRGGRKVAVLGDMLELGDYTKEGHELVGQRVAGVVDLLITVGQLGRDIGTVAESCGFPIQHLHRLDNHIEAVDLLKQEIRADDIVLVKGSRAVGMDTIAAEIVDKSAKRGTQKEA